MKIRLFLPAVIVLSLGLWLGDPGAVRAAAEGGSGDKWGVWLTVGRFFNLAILVGVLVRIGRKPLGSFFANRTRSIHEALETAETARRAAEEKLREMEARMGHLDEELDDMKAAAEKEAADEYSRLLADAERDAAKLLARARAEIDGMTRVAHLELKAHAAELSVELAEAMLRSEITDDDRGQLFRRFVQGLPAGDRR